ncbi:MAG: hypothetical protein AAFP28_01970 [Pseudomonadota bacterium]
MILNLALRTMGAGRRLLTMVIVWPLAGGTARVLTLAVLAFILAYYIPSREQAISVSAVTEELVVEVTSNDLVWDLTEIGMCYEQTAGETPDVSPLTGLSGEPPETTQVATAPAQDSTSVAKFELDPAIPNCAHTDVVPKGLEFATIVWPERYRLTFRAFKDDHVELAVSFPEDAAPVVIEHESPDGDILNSLVTQGTTLRIPYMAGGERTVLPLRGYVTVGSRPSTASSHILQSGRYEGRQILRANHAPIVSANELFPGDRVSFERRPPPLWARIAGLQSAKEPSQAPESRAFLTDLNPRTRAFDVVVTTERFFGTLLFTRVGGLPTDVTPAWTARLAADALPVAVATILGLVATLLALLKSYMPPGPTAQAPSTPAARETEPTEAVTPPDQGGPAADDLENHGPEEAPRVT